MNVLVVGSGGREHALAWKLAQSDELGQLHAAPGNPGIAATATCHPVRADDAEALLALCIEREIGLVVIGPEAPLVAGVADVLRHGGVAVLGPGAEAAQIEGSKTFAKDVLRAAGVPAAADLDAPRAPCVVKADGLAAGKGVFVCRTQAEADDAWRRAHTFGGAVVVEELLEGEELSRLRLMDGVDAVALPAARDAKRLLDGDEGPNTGGMGAYSPVPGFDEDETAELVERIHKPVLRELARRGLAVHRPALRGADAHRGRAARARVQLPVRRSRDAGRAARPGRRPARAVRAAARGDLGGAELSASGTAAVTVVLASPGYPDAPVSGSAIEGIEDAEAAGALVFHAGTALRDGDVISAGGRVLGVTGCGATLAEARDQAYEGAGRIRLPDVHYRRDIAAAAVHVTR